METGLYDKHHFPSELFVRKTDNASGSESGTFNADPYSLVTNPNDFLNFDQMTDDPLEDIRVNATMMLL